MDGDKTADSKAHLRINHVETDIKEMKSMISANGKCIRTIETNMAGMKSEIRIIGGLIVGAVSVLIGLVLINIVG
jgi:hypothetical protein